jgi:hypothetical protein
MDNAGFSTGFGPLDLAFLPDGISGYDELAAAAT